MVGGWWCWRLPSSGWFTRALRGHCGGWDTDAWERECAREGHASDLPHTFCGGHGSMARTDPGTTGLALLAFLAAGSTIDSGPHSSQCVA